MFAKKYSKSAMRAVEILLHLSEVGRPLRAAEIADTLEMARSSADQLLKSMVESGYLLLSPYDKTYSPSPRLARFGGGVSTRFSEFAALQNMVFDLQGTLGEIVTLTVQNDCYMQILEIAGPNGDPTLVSGAHVPIIGTAAGAAALCTQSTQQIRRVVTRSRYHALPTSPAESKAFMDSLSYFRQVGYSAWPTRRPVADWESYEKDYLTVAVNVPSETCDAKVVLSTTGRAAEYRGAEKSLAKLLQTSIHRRTAEIGGPQLAHA
jgi:DNA-binding IclR family transcriptional regulator